VLSKWIWTSKRVSALIRLSYGPISLGPTTMNEQGSTLGWIKPTLIRCPRVRVGGLDTDTWELVDLPGLVYHFPRSAEHLQDSSGDTFNLNEFGLVNGFPL